MRPAFACQCHRNFYPRPPRGGRPVRFFRRRAQSIFLSTPSARRATHMPTSSRAAERFLSTPSARRATRYAIVNVLLCFFISIHALREEGDVVMRMIAAWSMLFLSTPSARRATISTIFQQSFQLNFYPRPPRGGRPTSISVAFAFFLFLSTPSARRATLAELQNIMLRAISIHALREEGDSKNRDKISIFKQIIQHSARI